jgi:hypothetical protein
MQKWQKTISKPNMALHHSQFRNSPSQANRRKGSLGDGPINLSDPSECIFYGFRVRAVCVFSAERMRPACFGES